MAAGRYRFVLPTVCLAVLLSAFPGVVGAQGTMSGTSVADSSEVPTLGLWKYCVTISWDTGTQYALSHLNVGLGLVGCSCVCEGFSFTADDTAGYSTGVSNDIRCEVFYHASFICDGDPSIPGVDGPLVKFEPFTPDCDPGVIGSGVFCFYSEWPPEPVAAQNSLLSMKFDGLDAYGELTGVLPGCAFPSATESESWGGVKRFYR